MTTRKWGSEKLVSTTTARAQLNSSVALLADGGFMVVWQDGDAVTSDAAIRGQRFDVVGNKVGSELLLFATAPGLDQTAPSVVGLPDGNFYMAWNRQFSATDDDVQGYVFSPAGTFIRSQNFESQNAADDEFNGDVAAFAAGGSVMVWQQAAVGAFDFDIYMAIYDAAGNPITIPSIPVAVADPGFGESFVDPQVAIAADGTILVTYNSNNGGGHLIEANLYTASGGFITSFSASGVGLIAEAHSAPVWLSGGSFAIAWTDDGSTEGDGISEIKARVFDAAGNALTGAFLVNATVAGEQSQPVIAALPGGGFVVAWEDGSLTGADSSGTAIRLQAFDGLGARLGTEIVVNTTTMGFQLDPSIAALADGRVVVTWTDDPSGSIHMQIVDPRDGLVTGTPGNETLYGHELVNDEISGYAGNDNLYGLGGNDGLYGGEGNDVLTGGLGDDQLFGGDGNDSLRGGPGGDALDGGAGIDVADYSAALASLKAALDGSLVATGDATGDTFVAVEDMRGANIAGAGDTLRGNAGANTLTGNAGNDNLNGRAGTDKLIGGAGADTLTGELGNDQFIYNAPSEGGDTLTDFSSNAAGNNDFFNFRGSAFGGLPAGAILASQFQSSTSNVAGTASVRFFYETDTHILRFDADGSGGGSAPVVIATLQASATLVISDISIF